MTTESNLDRLIRWATGFHADPPGNVCREAVLESASLRHELAAAHGPVSRETTVFAPAGAGERTIAYEGSFTDVGGEVTVGEDFFLQIQDYMSTAFAPVSGPALVRVTGEGDYAAFLAGADAARRDGEFPAYLTHPMVRLADVCALGNQHPCWARNLARLHAAADGLLRTSPSGAVIGKAGQRTDQLLAAVAEMTGDPCLGEAISTWKRQSASRERPWLSRYLWALDGLREVQAKGLPQLRVSGFSGHLIGAFNGKDLANPESPDVPILLYGDETCILRHGPTGRSFRVGRDAARVAEMLAVLGNEESAIAFAREHLGWTRRTSEEAVTQVSGEFRAVGIDLTGSQNG